MHSSVHNVGGNQTGEESKVSKVRVDRMKQNSLHSGVLARNRFGLVLDDFVLQIKDCLLQVLSVLFPFLFRYQKCAYE